MTTRPQLLRVLLLVAVAGCGGGDNVTPPPPPQRVPASVVINVSSTNAMTSFGETRTLTAVVRDSSQEVMPSATVSWSSNAAGVVAVTPSTGLSTTATAVSDGNATITATSGPASATVGTSVLQRLSTVVVDPLSFGLTVGGSRLLTATARDARGNLIAGVSGFAFNSSNTSVATVTTSGTVNAAAVGTATITASATHNTVTAAGTSTVTVSAGGGNPTSATVATTSSSFDPSSVTIAPGGTVTWQFGAIAHNVNFAAGSSIANIPTTTNGSVSRTFPSAGTFPYNCNLHEGMTGTVNVN